MPGISSPGRPNDYINLFLEESKAWMRAQMTLDAVHSDELARRDNFYTKLKNDNYFWYVHFIVHCTHIRSTWYNMRVFCSMF